MGISANKVLYGFKSSWRLRATGLEPSEPGSECSHQWIAAVTVLEKITDLNHKSLNCISTWFEDLQCPTLQKYIASSSEFWTYWIAKIGYSIWRSLSEMTIALHISGDLPLYRPIIYHGLSLRP